MPISKTNPRVSHDLPSQINRDPSANEVINLRQTAKDKINQFAPLLIGMGIGNLLSRRTTVRFIAKKLNYFQAIFGLKPKSFGINRDYNWFAVRKYKNLGEYVHKIHSFSWGYRFKIEYSKPFSAFAAGIVMLGLSSLLSPDTTAKKDSLDLEVNTSLAIIREKGMNIEELYTEQKNRKEQTLYEGIEEIESILIELPLDEQDKFREILYSGLDQFREEYEKDKAAIEDVLMKFQDLDSLTTERDGMAGIKNFAGAYSAPFIKFVLALAIGRSNLAKAAFEQLKTLPIPKKFVDSVVKSVVILILQSVVTSNIARDVTENDVKRMGAEICSKMGLDIGPSTGLSLPRSINQIF